MFQMFQVCVQEQQESGVTRIRAQTHPKTTKITERYIRYDRRGIRMVLQSQANGRQQTHLLLIGQFCPSVCFYLLYLSKVLTKFK